MSQASNSHTLLNESIRISGHLVKDDVVILNTVLMFSIVGEREKSCFTSPFRHSMLNTSDVRLPWNYFAKDDVVFTNFQPKLYYMNLDDVVSLLL